MGKPISSPKTKTKSTSSKAQTRLAEALRENLLRRKAQQRARAPGGVKPRGTKA